MQLDSVTAEIRPRSDWEAVDLGFAMVRRDFWRSLAIWWLGLLLPTLVAIWLLWDHPFVLLTLFWWLKPIGSRLVLFELSRRLFGEKPSWDVSLQQIPRTWIRRFFYRFFIARWSPWFYVTMAVEDLEGLRGKLYRQRCRQLSRRGDSAVMWLFLISDLAACWLGCGLMILVMMLIPEGQDGAWQRAVESWDPSVPFEIPIFILRLMVFCVMAAMSLTDGFVTGAGFGVYLNNRTWLEGWDVELAFKRMAQRLAGVLLAVILCDFASQVALGNPIRPPIEVIHEVKADPAFTVHTVTERVPVEKESVDFSWFSKVPIQTAVELFVWGIAALIVVLLGWVLWKNRHVFGIRIVQTNAPRSFPAARVIMGLEISPDTLPVDVPNTAWDWWREGRHHEALRLLYRGAISRMIEEGRVEIQESDTEGDCMRRVAQLGIEPDYFREITLQWTKLAYAGQVPAEADVQALCRHWPYDERRAK